MRVTVESVDEAARLRCSVPERRVRVQRVTLKRAARAHARARRAPPRRLRVRVIIIIIANHLPFLSVRSDARRAARAAPQEVLETRAGARCARFLPEGRRELARAHGHVIRGVWARVRRVRPGAPARVCGPVREALELFLQVFAVVHGASAGRGSVQRRLDVARRQIHEIQERLHLAVSVGHRTRSNLRAQARASALEGTLSIITLTEAQCL